MPITHRRFPNLPRSLLLLLVSPLGCHSDSSDPETRGTAVTRLASAQPGPRPAPGLTKGPRVPEQTARALDQDVRQAAGVIADGIGDL
jgi:hypothetical protein